MENRIIKIIFIILLSLILCFSILHETYALDNIIKNADDWLKDGIGGTGPDPIDSGKTKAASDQIYNMLLAIGIFLSVVIAIVLGIQFMTGSIETKAKVKESLIPFVVGSVIIFGAFSIWRIAVVIGERLSS